MKNVHCLFEHNTDFHELYIHVKLKAEVTASILEI